MKLWLGTLRSTGGLTRHACAAEGVGGTLKQLPAPFGHLVGVHIVLLGHLDDRLAVAHGVQCRLGLEGAEWLRRGLLLIFSAPVLPGSILAIGAAFPLIAVFRFAEPLLCGFREGVLSYLHFAAA